MSDFTNEDQRSFIKVQIARNVSVQEIAQQLHEACGDSAFKERTVRKWAARFKEGISSTADCPRSGRPSTAVTEDNCSEIESLLETDRRWTCEELSQELSISPQSVLTILTDNLGLKKICARWVPHALSQEQKDNRVRIARQLRSRWRREGESFLNQIITLDETWVRAYEPELKSQSAEWHHKDSPKKSRPQKFRQGPSPLKLMIIVAYDSAGVVLVHAVPRERTVNADYYRNFLQNNLRAAIRKKRPHLLESAILLHDNARPHTARVVQDLIDSYGWETLSHPPYSPDLSPCDFHLFPAFKLPMRGKRYSSVEEAFAVADRFIRDVVLRSPAGGIPALPGRWDRVIDAEGEYFEGM